MGNFDDLYLFDGVGKFTFPETSFGKQTERGLHKGFPIKEADEHKPYTNMYYHTQNCSYIVPWVDIFYLLLVLTPKNDFCQNPTPNQTYCRIISIRELFCPHMWTDTACG